MLHTYLANLNSGTSIKDFIQSLLDSAEFESDVLPQGLDTVVFDMIKNILHKVPTDEEISQGVARFNSGEGAEFIIELMNDPSVIQRFENS